MEIEGGEYKVVENMGYQNGLQVKAVKTSDGERVVTKAKGGQWKFAIPTIEPLGRYSGQ